ncbi:MAG: flagellar basal body-associated FliL family protein [Pseudomonadota bacterium]
MALADGAATTAGSGAVVEAGEGRAKRGFMLPLIAIVLAGAGGGGMFFAVSEGMAPAPSKLIASLTAPSDVGPKEPLPAFVTLPTLTISLGPDATASYLRISVVLEVAPEAQGAVEELSPRLVAVLTRFLRAVDERDFEQPALMLRLQEQMLRRLEMAAPEGAVQAVLLQEFLLN